MRSSDISLTITILLIFAGMYLYNILAVGIKNIQDNWPEYRCNPSVMPFAGMFGHEVGSNFTYCIQNMQSDYMGHLLQPLQYLTNIQGNTMGKLMASIQDIRGFFNVIRNFVSSIVQSIFGVFLNILIQFQVMIIKMKDMVGKVIGTMATMMFILQGTVMTMESTWAGPPGSMIRMMSKMKI